jgi:phage terminase large subunit-like protein
MEDEVNPEVYGCAAARDQAGLIFKTAAQLVKANPVLRSRLRLLESTKRILRHDHGGFYVVLSADGDVQDGIRPSLLLRDEVHRWKTPRAETLFDVATKGQISRREPLDLGISTAGAEYESPLWFREYEHSKHILDRSLKAPSYYAAIYEADAKKIESDSGYWISREARVAANPSHEDLGGFLKDAAIVGELEKAIAQPSERSKYLRYHLNVPMKTQEDPIIDMSKWQQCGGGEELREWPAFDFELLMQKWNLIEKP